MADQIGNFIICPYCDYIFPDMCDYPEEKDIVDGMEMECENSNCKRTFTVIGELHWTFQTYRKCVNQKEGE